MEEKKLIEICNKALQSFNLSTTGLDYPLNVILKGSTRDLKSFQLVLFLMEVESGLEELEVAVDLFDLVGAMGDDVSVIDLVTVLSKNYLQ